MLIRDIKECKEFIAGDGSILREFLNPNKEDLKVHYSLAQAKVSPGETTKPHKLKTTEVYYILEGKGIIYVDDEKAQVHPHQAIYIPPNSTQYIQNIGDSDLKFLCIVDPAWRPEDEEVF